MERIGTQNPYWACLDSTCSGKMSYDETTKKWTCQSSGISTTVIIICVAFFIVGFGLGFIMIKQFRSKKKGKEQQLSLMEGSPAQSKQDLMPPRL